jgi:hypothetical protein
MPEDSKSSGPDLAKAIPVVMLIATVLCHFFFQSTPVDVVGGILLLIVIVFYLVSRTAATRVRNPRQKDLPRPASFWRTFYFQVPPSTTTARSKFKIKIVHDESSLKAAGEVADRHPGPDWDIELLPINPEMEEDKQSRVNDAKNPAVKDADKLEVKQATGILPEKLEEADAVYFCWTEKVQKDEVLQKTLNEWTAKKGEVPVLMVNPFNIPYDLKFASMKPADTGPAHLLFHSISRSKLWIQLAKQLYRWSSFATILCLVATMTLIYGGIQLRRTQQRLANRDYIDDTDFNKLATALSEVVRNEKVSANGPVMLNDALDKVAQFTLNDIVRTAEVGSAADDHISVFRKLDADQQNSQESLVEVVGPHPLVKFYSDQRSIAGCSVLTKSFVLWEEGCTRGASAAWDTHGKPIGSCWVEKNQEGKPNYSILLDPDYNNAVCRLDPTSALLNNHGILCYSAAVQISTNQSSADTAVCLVTSGATDWLSRPAVRAKLRMFTLVANSLPTSTLVSVEQRPDSEANPKPQPNGAGKSH